MPKPLPAWTDDVTTLETFARVRLVAVDIDGTLLADRSSRLYGVVSRLHRYLASQKSPVLLTIATGRALNGVRTLLTDLKVLKSVPVVLYNGSVIVRPAPFLVVEVKTLPLDALQRVIEIGWLERIPILAYFFGAPTLSPFDAADTETVLGWTFGQAPSMEGNGLSVRWQAVGDVPRGNASAVLLDISDRVESAVRIEECLASVPGISLTRSGGQYLEIRPAESNKGLALRRVSEYLGVPREAVLALGDSDNDVEMLRWAGIGVAVSTASNIALLNSDYVCKYGAADGVVEVLKLLKQARRYFLVEDRTSSHKG